MVAAKKVVVKQDESAPVTVEILAQSIIAISEGVKKLRAGPLNERCLVLLIQNAAPAIKGRYAATPITQKQVKTVLDGMEQLQNEYLKPRKQ